MTISISPIEFRVRWATVVENNILFSCVTPLKLYFFEECSSVSTNTPKPDFIFHRRCHIFDHVTLSIPQEEAKIEGWGINTYSVAFAKKYLSFNVLLSWYISLMQAPWREVNIITMGNCWQDYSLLTSPKVRLPSTARYDKNTNYQCKIFNEWSLK